MEARACDFPNESKIANEVILADFNDSYKISSVEYHMSPLEIYLLMVNNTPIWINFLLSLRNKIVRLLGLNDVGNLGGIDHLAYVKSEDLVGAKLDFFVIESLDQNEMILILKDKHLDIKISIFKYENVSSTDVIVSTIVNFHNYVGKIYMFIIAPFHRMVVKRLMKNIIFNKAKPKK